SARVATQVDDQAINSAKFLHGAGDLVRNLNPNHAREHCNLQVAQPVTELPRLDERGLDEVELLPLGPCYFNGNSASLVAIVYKFHICLLAHREDRMFGRSNLPAIDTEKDIPRLNAGDRCCSSCVDILKDPTFSIRCLVFKVGCAECGPARRSAGTAVKEAQ